MRALSPLTLTLTNHRIWNAAVCGLAALAGAALTGWALAWAQFFGAVQWAGLCSASAAIVAVGLLARGALLGGTLHLRWDRAAWHLGEAPRAADCRLVLDLGHCMLLRCRTAEAITWVPLWRHDLRADWHALRCAIHAPRPATSPAT